MAEIITKFLNGSKFDLVCTSGNRRGGFYHQATLYRDDVQQAAARVNYVNRTWEAFLFDSVKSALLDNMRNEVIKERRVQFMTMTGARRMTARRRAEFVDGLRHHDPEVDYIQGLADAFHVHLWDIREDLI